MLKDSVLFPPTGRKKDNNAEFRKGSTALKHPTHIDPLIKTLVLWIPATLDQSFGNHLTIKVKWIQEIELYIPLTTVYIISAFTQLRERSRRYKIFFSLTSYLALSRVSLSPAFYLALLLVGSPLQFPQKQLSMEIETKKQKTKTNLDSSQTFPFASSWPWTSHFNLSKLLFPLLKSEKCWS